MADCSYARCMQERRFIKRELSKWTKGMVFIVGLERVAEELMGRRKWKLYQEVIARSNQSILNSSNSLHQESSVANQNNGFQQQQQQQQQQQLLQELQQQQQQQKYLTEDEEKLILLQKNLENHLKENDKATIKCESIVDFKAEEDDLSVTKPENQENLVLDSEVTVAATKNLVKVEPNTLEDLTVSSGNNNNITTTNDKDANAFLSKIQQIKKEEERSIIIEDSHLNSKPVATPETEDLTRTSDIIPPKTLPPTENIPIDWKPQKECYFCVDGKLLTVNEKGELVAESGSPAPTAADIANRSPHESDSDSSDSGSDTEVQNSSKTSSSTAPHPAVGNKTLESLLRGNLPSNMTSFETMAATLQAVARLQGLQQVPGLSSIYSGLFYPHHGHHQIPQSGDSHSSTHGDGGGPSQQQQQQTTSLSSPNRSENAPTAEQPLDLSAKSSTPIFPSNDSRIAFQNISRAKPRVSTVAGRRTYTEEELQRALHDIMSGKLGTRRAAVLYGIPRSTLRNKVYKLAMEQKRESLVMAQPVLNVADDEEKDSDGDDDKDVEKMLPTASLSINMHSKEHRDHRSAQPSPTVPSSQATPPTTPIQNPWLDQTLMLQSLLLSGAIPGLIPPKPEDLPEFVRTIMMNAVGAAGVANTSEHHLNNGKPAPTPSDTRFASLLQHQHQLSQRLSRKSETPETISSVEVNESDDSSVILKIPSFNPSASGSGGGGPTTSSSGTVTPKINSSLNNDNLLGSPGLHQQHHHHLNNSSTPKSRNSPPSSHLMSAGMSPTLKRQSSESQSPSISGESSYVSLQEVIAKSISKNFQQQHSSDLINKHHHSPDPMEQYKRAPQISVIKNIGGSDMSRFGASPNIMNSSLSNSLTGTGGKGTRPKRGKYRNYDRDSLVEAVKAVQRGEMSVHRAGSYYGVPHSTLEYKVKERHLMRPRKREPKPQPLDGDRTSTSSTSVANSKPSDLSGASGTLRTLDKSKILSSTKPPHKTPPYPATSPNGLKMPMFDPAMAVQYSPHLFWPHPHGFSGPSLMDFAARGSPQGGAATSQFPPNAEQFFASQMISGMHKFQQQEDASRSHQLKSTQQQTTNNNQIKTTRELAESIYDSNNANGSLLDGIIRQSLDRGKHDIAHGALIDQFVKNHRSNSIASDETSSNNGSKRPGSPLNYSHIDIKKERSSPLSSSDSDRDSPESHNHSSSGGNKDSVENLIKLRDGLTLRLDEQQHMHHQHQLQQHLQTNNSKMLADEINGKSLSSLHINNQSDNDDST